uniref:PH domain-containing protein n=1 Tax=Mola mola TaxID=94237 RepID=A0A3Q3X0I5_MOLML
AFLFPSGLSTIFYTSVGIPTEVRSGYFLKSPPQNKSWKRRFFVLFKVSEQDYQLKYFNSSEERDKPAGEIDLLQVSFLWVSPQQHSRWGWINKNLKCSPSTVLCIRAGDRDYFLIGESRSVSSGWCRTLNYFTCLGRPLLRFRCMFTRAPKQLPSFVFLSSIDAIIPEERDIEVKQADLKKHLTVTEVDGKPIVSSWTGQPQLVCLFHKGDQILAINDLHTSSVEEVNKYLSKCLKNEVKVTILRRHRCQPLHSSACWTSTVPGRAQMTL